MKIAILALGFLAAVETGFGQCGVVGTGKDTALPHLILHCHNPDLNVKFVEIGPIEAVTELVQVNVNRAAVAGSTLFLNPSNDVICTARLTGAYRIIDGIAVTDKTQISGFEGFPESAHGYSWIIKSIESEAITFQLLAPYHSIPRGNIAYRFHIIYEPVR